MRHIVGCLRISNAKRLNALINPIKIYVSLDKARDAELADDKLFDKKRYMDNEDFRRSFHFAHGGGSSSLPSEDESPDMMFARWRKRAKRLRHLKFKNKSFYQNG